MLSLIRNILSVIVAVKRIAHQEVSDVPLSVPKLIESHGYPAETHHVETEDGYILTLHRIPQNASSRQERLPVLVMHGIFCSSADFLVTGPGQALGFILSDAGYDVWMGNFRGNTYSKKHVNYSTSSDAFWNFSFHEISIFDLPAMIDYILDKTNNKQLFYIGHSMGSNNFYVLMSMKPEYNSKIKLMCSFAPIAFLDNMKSPLFRIAAHGYRPEELLSNIFSINELAPYNEKINDVKSVLCLDGVPTQPICAIVIFSLSGYDWKQLNQTQLPVILSYFPAGLSTKVLLHFFQETVSGHFRQYDYGKTENKQLYGTPEPPDYNLTRVTAPVVLYYTGNDWFSSIIDVTRLNASLGNPVGMIRVPYEKFNHMDYLWAIDAKSLLYDPVIDIFKKYS